MPIKGMTDSVAKPRFPILGRLYKGAPRPEGGSRPGADLTYFRFEPMPGRPVVGETFTKLYGEQPSSLTVFLAYASIEDSFPTWNEQYSASGLLHRCDGEFMTIWRDEQGRYQRGRKPCPYAGLPVDKRPQDACRPVGRLYVILPELLRAGFVGTVVLRTTSVHDIISIHSALLAVVEARGEEDLRGVAFQLYRATESVSVPTAEGKRLSREMSLVKLVPAVEYVRSQLAIAAKETMALPIPDGTELDMATGEVIPVVEGEVVGESDPFPQDGASEPPRPKESTGDAKSAAQRERQQREWVGRFLDAAVKTYSHVPGISREMLLQVLRTTEDRLVARRLAGDRAFSAKELKRQLDEALTKGTYEEVEPLEF